MIKFVASLPNGRKLVGLGIDEDNVSLLKSGRPIIVALEDLQFLKGVDSSKVDVTLFYGKTVEDLERDLSEYVSPQTKVIRTRPKGSSS